MKNITNVTDRILENVVESTGVGDIAKIDSVLVGLIKEKYNSSLLYSICDVIPMKSPIGKIFYSRHKSGLGNNDFEIIKLDVEAKTTITNTKFTHETYEDIKHLYGEDATSLASKVLRGISDVKENLDLRDFLLVKSEPLSDLDLSVSVETDTNSKKILAKVGESVLKMNYTRYKTLQAWCILPRQYAAFILTYPSLIKEPNNPSKFYVGTISNVDFYVDPINIENKSGFERKAFTNGFLLGASNLEEIYIGLKDKEIGNASLVFSPYSYEMDWVIDPLTVEHNLFLRNRYALNVSPLHDNLSGGELNEATALLHNFKINKVE